MRIVVEIDNEKDVPRLVNLVSELKGRIIELGSELLKPKSKIKINPVSYLEKIATGGGTEFIQNPNEWQKEIRKDKKLGGRD